jgi:hypothetical protein
MNSLLEPIERALAPDADAETKQAGAVACRAVLGALEAEPGKSITLPGVPLRPPSPLAGINADQFFDGLIVKLRSMTEAQGSAPASNNAASPLRIPMIVLPPPR